MKFKDYIKESIIDIPRRRYAPGVFDDADSNNPKLKKKVVDMILDQIDKFQETYPVKKYSLIGSILTKRYRDDADLDINVLFDVPEEDRETARKELASSLKDINGKLVPGTKHPVNYYVITDPELKKKNDAMADGVYDIDENEFIRRPSEDTFDPEKYEADFQKKVREIDVVKGELARDLVDYEELKSLSTDDVLNLQDKINGKLEEIEDSIEVLVDIGDDVVKQRQSAFNDDMTPDEIREFGKKHKLPKNIIYKYLEKYHYLKMYKKLKDILEDGKVSDDELKDLDINEGGVFSAWDTLIRKTIKAPRIKMALQLYLKYLRQGVNDAKNKAAQHSGLGYREFGLAVKDAGLPESAITEQKAPKTIAFAFGRFNPPTIGHKKLMDKVKASSRDYKIYLSRSEDPKKNPLSPRDKLALMKRMFPTHARNIEINPSNNVLDILVKLYDTHHRVIMVAGSDRVREFDNLLKRYNNVKSRHGYYYFEDIKVVSAGERDPDAEGAEGMSASKMRAAAAKGDLEAFKKGLPGSSKGNGDTIMRQVRRGMNLAASYGGMLGVGLGTYRPVASLEQFEQNQIRDLYVREMIFNVNDKVDYVKEDIRGIVKRRGTNYVVIEDNNNNLHKAWIWDCLPVAADREVEVREYDTNVDYGFTAVDRIEEDLDATPQDKDVKKKKGTQPKKYYKGLSKDVKDKRADHFKKDKYKKGDTDYKPAPGDKDAKTKPSIHTKKFKQMYGEVVDKLDEKGKGLWHNIHMKRKRGERMRKKGEKGAPTAAQMKRAKGEQKEAYDVGHDYAQHTMKMTPGQAGYDPKHQGDTYKPSTPENNNKRVFKSFKDYNENDVKEKDIKEWSMSDATIDKYKERYKELWREKLNEVVKRMMDKI
jgi:phosphopantetheine adenylyltransferase/predicted nucleotidyltransferase